jgi:predicted methyltransferase
MFQENFSFFMKLYQEYKKFSKDFFVENYKNWIGSKKLLVSRLEKIFFDFEVDTFFNFLDKIRTLYYSGDVKEMIKKYNDDIWSGYELLSFLLNKELIRIKNEKVVFKDNFDSFFIKPLDEKEILNKLKDKLASKINLNSPLLLNLNPYTKFKWKAKYDQISITTKSAIFILSKISQYFPIRQNFIFVGDDDFLSIPFKMIFDAPTFSLDADESLLFEVEKLCKTFNLKVTTVKADVRKPKKFGKFYGCYINPPYNLPGSVAFLEFVSKILSRDGGVVFMVLGDDAIGRRFVHLQKNISNLGFIIREALPSTISCRFYFHHKEDEFIYKKMKNIGIDIKEKETIFAALYVFDFVGKVREFKFDKNIYSYI